MARPPFSHHPDQSPRIHENVAGRVKWFDLQKGFGFIVPDVPGPDILLRQECLANAGHQQAFDNAPIVVHAISSLDRNGNPKWSAYQVVMLDNSKGLSSVFRRQHKHHAVQAQSGWERAMVKSFNRTRGFAFLTRGENTPDIFLHMETIRGAGLAEDEVQLGKTLQVRYGEGEKGLVAVEIRADTKTPDPQR